MNTYEEKILELLTNKSYCTFDLASELEKIISGYNIVEFIQALVSLGMSQNIVMKYFAISDKVDIPYKLHNSPLDFKEVFDTNGNIVNDYRLVMLINKVK